MGQRKRINIGDSLVVKGDYLIVGETFTANEVRWVRCSRTRRRYRVRFYGKKYQYYDTENTYLTELEWIRLKKKI